MKKERARSEEVTQRGRQEAALSSREGLSLDLGGRWRPCGTGPGGGSGMWLAEAAIGMEGGRHAA